MSINEPRDPLQDLSPTKRALLLKALERQGAAARQAAPAIPRRGERDIAPLSFAQQRLWFVDQLDPGDLSYNVSFPARLSGHLDAALLRRSLAEIVRRQETLRTAFVMRSGEPRQSIEPFSGFALPLVDLRQLPAERREAELYRLAQEDGDRPFSLRRAPLLRGTLVRLAAGEHAVLFAMHHIVSDAWSLGVLWRELIACYGALAAGRPSPLQELPIQYADFAVWQRQWLQGERLARLLAFWRRRLAVAPELTELPADRRRRARHRSAGAEQSIALPTPLIMALRELATRRQATLFMAGLAAFKALVHRYTGSCDLVIGTPLSGRDLAELEPLIGYFVNTLPLRTDLGGNPTAGELLDRVAETTLGAFDHQGLPFEILVDELQPERSLSHSPIFQLAFVLDAGAGQPAARPAELALQPLKVPKSSAKFDLALELTAAPGAMATAQFSTDLFDRATVSRLLNHYAALLAAWPDALSQPVSELPLLGAAERHQLVGELASPQASVEPMLPLHRLFEAQAARTPAALAVVCGDAGSTYGDLNRRANQLARHLRGRGVGPEVVVALWLERSLDQVVAILAVLKAGGAYLAIEPAAPAARIDLMLTGARIEWGITHQNVARQLPAGGTRWVCLEREQAAIALHDGGDLADAPAVDGLAYLLYTSGSTGEPKGVLVTHRNVARLLAASRDHFDFGPQDVWTLFHSYSFDFSVWEMWGALVSGGRLVVVPYLVSRDPAAFYELLVEAGVTVLNQTPSAFRELAAAERQRAAPPVESLRHVVFGGEPLDFQALAPWFERHGDERPRLANMYGITETTVHVTWRPVRRGDLAGAAGSYIGLALADLALYLLDPWGGIAAAGTPAEIHVGGAGVARGYLGRPEQTAERFVPDPYSPAPGARLYRTGDLARWRSGGELEYLGRRDGQVKVRGFRIELGEIEAALAGHPALAEVAVAVRGAAGAQRLICYVVAAGVAPPVEALQSFARERLPDYMVPAVFLLLPALPRSANGKLDRAALPEPDGRRLEGGRPYVAPRTACERQLAAIWSEVLGVQRVGALDSFFALGGDSILSVRVISMATERGLRFSLQQLVEHQVLADLARAIERQGGAAAARPALARFDLVAEADRARLPLELEDAYPPSRLQIGMLYHSELNPAAALYHNITSFHVRVLFDPAVFEAAARQLFARHPILRTSFELASWSEPLQLVHAEVPVPLTVVDLRQLTGAAQERALAAWMEIEKRRHFDWSRPPLLRFHLHPRTAESFQFSITEHHSILDGWSVAQLLTELFKLYLGGLGLMAPPADPPPATGMRDFVSLEREALRDPACQAFWDRLLAEVEVATLPRWQAGPIAAGGDRVHNLAVPIDAAMSDGLKRLATAAGVPLKSVLLAAHLRALAQLTGRTDLLTGLVSHGRPESQDGERVLGLFLNTVPLRQRLAPGTWVDLVQATFAAENALLPFRRFPLADIQARQGGQSLFESAFNFVHFHAYEQLGELPQVEVLGAAAFQQTHFTLMANFRLTLGTRAVLLELQYDGRELAQAQLAAAAGIYARILERMAMAPQERQEACVLLAECEVQALLREANDTAVELAGGGNLYQLFAAQAAAAPGAPAVIAEQRSVSYGELHAAAELLGDRLRGCGIGPESLVGVAMERAPEMIAALLGVLAAGAAYVPLDPDQPAERLAFMIEDSGATVLLCQPGTAANLPLGPASTLIVEGLPDTTPAASLPARDRRLVPEQAAYMIYTSGSTGRPKGALNTHRGICNRLLWMQARYRLGTGDRVLHKTTASFDVSVWEIFWPLATGASLVLARPGGQNDPAYLIALIGEQGVTTVHFVPSMLRAFLAEPGVERATSLRHVVASGEALPRELVQQFYRVFPAAGVTIHNLYGPTEAAIDVTSWACGREAGAPAVPIGRPVANSRVLLLDPWLAPSPLGTPGEIHLGGVQLARGYHRRPDLTATHFVPDPWSELPGERLYRTGDLGRRLPDGSIDFLGRLDFQVKLRGYRIELGEIEAALRQHGAVADAAVAVRDGSGGHRRLVAYVVGRQESVPVAELVEFLRTRLPAYMVPAVLTVLPALPLTPSGKLDRRALPAPSEERPDLRSAYAAPQTASEEAMARIWAEVLQVDRVGIDDNFFTLGGDSMLSLQILSRARREGLRFELQDLYQRQTIRELALLATPPPDDDEALLRMLESLSEDEVKKNLQSLKSPVPGSGAPE
jgi:amino acid adenylation domain-containing protein